MANKLSVLLMLSILLFGGCASARRGIGDNIEAEKVVDIVPGQTTKSEIRTIFGKPDIVKELDGDVLEYTYTQGKNDSVSWLILSGYLVYHSTRAFSGSRILTVRFKGEEVERFIASDGRLTLKKGYEEEQEPTPDEGK